ncbi:MAG: helix-turn-helix transcriptional regulator [Moraxellaceae bacterium]|nr:helix-turn-helix transcriptional regulator [Moraxellaceae bacterium]
MVGGGFAADRRSVDLDAAPAVESVVESAVESGVGLAGSRAAGLLPEALRAKMRSVNTPASTPRPALSMPGVFHLSHHRASLPQRIRRVSVFRPLLIRVAVGTKRLFAGAALVPTHEVPAGGIAAFAARTEVDLMNVPSQQGYLAEVLNIAPDAVEAFRGRHGLQVNALLDARGDSAAPIQPGPALASAWQHLLELWQHEQAPQPDIARHRLEEVLLCLVLQGAGHVLFVNRHDAWSERLRAILQAAPAAKWSAAEVATRLHCSEATLRRHLASEGTHLRDMLDAIRMNMGLGLVLNTQRRIDDIAQACGYDSASRFSIRFRQRFGVSPTEMRATR